jgi:hypothetical protein
MTLSSEKLVASVKAEVESLVAYDSLNTQVYLVGSLSDSKHTVFNDKLSDIDLLIVPKCGSLGNYVSHFEQAIRMSKTLKDQHADWCVDLFFMSARIARSYFKLLPVIAGGRELSEGDLIYGATKDKELGPVLPSLATKQRFYFAKLIDYIGYCERLMPIADTSGARSQAKQMVRAMKIATCAMADIGDFKRAEALSLESENTMASVISVLEGFMDISLQSEFSQGDILRDGQINDWSQWMKIQDVFARYMTTLGLSFKLSAEDKRRYLCYAKLRDMLNRELKNILSQADDTQRRLLIERYVNDAASVLTRLALDGLSCVANLEEPALPKRITRSYDILVGCLQGDICDLRALAASVVLLEFAMEESISSMNQEDWQGINYCGIIHP